MSSVGTTKAKQTGRRAETPEQQLARAERNLQAAREAVAEANRQRWAVIGEAVEAEAKGDAKLTGRLHDILRRRVTAKASKAVIASLMAEPSAAEAAAPVVQGHDRVAA